MKYKTGQYVQNRVNGRIYRIASAKNGVYELSGENEKTITEKYISNYKLTKAPAKKIKPKARVKPKK